MKASSHKASNVSKKSKNPIFNVNKFDATLMTDQVAVEIAIGDFEAYLVHPAADVGRAVREMLPVRNLIEFVLSGEIVVARLAVNLRQSLQLLVIRHLPQLRSVYWTWIASQRIQWSLILHWHQAY